MCAIGPFFSLTFFSQVTALDKDSRRTIHKCVKEAFKDINSNTTEKDGKKYVVFSLGKGVVFNFYVILLK